MRAASTGWRRPTSTARAKAAIWRSRCCTAASPMSAWRAPRCTSARCRSTGMRGPPLCLARGGAAAGQRRPDPARPLCHPRPPKRSGSPVRDGLRTIPALPSPSSPRSGRSAGGRRGPCEPPHCARARGAWPTARGCVVPRRRWGARAPTAPPGAGDAWSTARWGAHGRADGRADRQGPGMRGRPRDRRRTGAADGRRTARGRGCVVDRAIGGVVAGSRGPVYAAPADTGAPTRRDHRDRTVQMAPGNPTLIAPLIPAA